MINRTFKQRGQAHGLLPVSISAKIDGVEVYNGVVSTVNTPYNLTDFDAANGMPGEDLFSWNDVLDFEGNKSMEITVTDGFVVFMDTLVNYTYPGTTPTRYGPVYIKDTDLGTDTNATINISINGVLQDQNNGCLGQTYWLIPPGGVLTCTVRVSPSSFIPPPVV